MLQKLNNERAKQFGISPQAALVVQWTTVGNRSGLSKQIGAIIFLRIGMSNGVLYV